jgi:hypothetical protein
MVAINAIAVMVAAMVGSGGVEFGLSLGSGGRFCVWNQMSYQASLLVSNFVISADIWGNNGDNTTALKHQTPLQ